MTSSGKGKEFLEEFREFIAFLQNLWGILASISILFPLSNKFFKLIPLRTFDEDGVFNHLSPSLITAIAMLICLFIILSTFSSRHTFNTQRKSKIQTRARTSFIVGILALVVYLVIYVVYSEYAWQVWGWGSDDPRKLFVEVPLMITYILFFALTTKAFMLLAMIEFFGQER